ncbi:MAG: hypothetical protein JF625_14035 [Inquilinus limosus]|uniref:Uncharacterized protein n=1 Tax=Inquilinus limosus TaxID=171674 RepID=A0A952KDP1_9PROT|nr:hypothetical protein [Inquilinus limosus]
MISLRSMSPLRKGVLALAAVALVVGLVWDRSPASELTIPPWPAGVGEADEYPFGVGIMLRDQRAWKPVFKALAERYGGKYRLREIHLTLDAKADVGAVRSHFDEEMINRRHWRAETQETGRPRTWTHGYESSDGRDVFMLVGIEPLPGETLVPLNILTTIPMIPGR